MARSNRSVKSHDEDGAGKTKVVNLVVNQQESFRVSATVPAETSWEELREIAVLAYEHDLYYDSDGFEIEYDSEEEYYSSEGEVLAFQKDGKWVLEDEKFRYSTAPNGNLSKRKKR
jgi:hypothetical protein